MNDNIKVSILCTAYNHEKYIAKAIESFVNQKTNFNYEILINDDCSTDNTAKIIKEYEDKYENITAIYQKENQYSRGVKITLDILIPMAKGKYFAICEGDDYWIDEYKLQKQFDFMENNKEYSLCVHNAIKVDNDENKIGNINVVYKDMEVDIKNVIYYGGAFMATNSIFAPIKLFKERPDFVNEYSLDYVWQIYLASKGRTYCFNDYMSAYRVNSIGSWNVRMKNQPEKFIEHNERVLSILMKFDNYTNNKYHSVIEKTKIKRKFDMYVFIKNYDALNDEPYRTYMKTLPFKNRLVLYLTKRYPKFIERVSKIRWKT